MTEGHIYIYGIIEPDNHSLQSVLAQLQSVSDAEKIIVHIRSEGGDVDEGYSIYNALTSSHKQITTIGEGIVASIATIPFMAGTIRILAQRSEFLIHNPWNAGKGTAADFEQNAKHLRETESTMLDFYTAHTKTDKVILQNLMNSETMLTADQAVEYGFATEIMHTFKAVALFNNPNILTMTNEEFDAKLEGKLNTFWDKVKNLFSPVKNLKITAGDGTVLDFGEQVQEQKEIAVGMTATIDGGGTPAGEYVMPDGGKLTFEAGKVTAITPVVEDKTEALTQENTDLKAQIETLKTENTQAKLELDTAKASIEGIKTEFTSLKAQIKSDVEGFVKEIKKPDEPEVRKVNKQLI